MTFLYGVHRTIGSLCTGYGGLDLAAQAVLGSTVAWHVENDPNASLILAHHWPDVPNLGDLTAIDWTQVEPVDVLTAGYPCQPFSYAGKRKGSADVRHLWPHIIRAVRHLRPRLVLLENVAGHLTLGFGDVLADLAEAGFDAEWVVLRAADVGAPHGRARVFVVAQDAHVAARGERWLAAPGQAEGGRPRPDTGRRGGAPAPHPGGERHGGGQDSLGVGRVDSEDESEARERERSRAVAGDRSGCSLWGQYAPAVHRWEMVLNRVAPAPTQMSARGKPRLSARAVEWMMGLPDGHVTAVPGLTRNAQLKALGNGVVPAQAAAAFRVLLAACNSRKGVS